jgi:hypothetical protein
MKMEGKAINVLVSDCHIYKKSKSQKVSSPPPPKCLQRYCWSDCDDCCHISQPTIAVMLGGLIIPTGKKMDILLSCCPSSLRAPPTDGERKKFIYSVFSSAYPAKASSHAGLFSRFSHLMLGGIFHLYCTFLGWIPIS